MGLFTLAISIMLALSAYPSVESIVIVIATYLNVSKIGRMNSWPREILIFEQRRDMCICMCVCMYV